MPCPNVIITPTLDASMSANDSLKTIVRILCDSGLFLPDTTFDICGNQCLRFWVRNLNPKNTDNCICIILDKNDTTCVKIRVILENNPYNKWVKFMLAGIGSSSMIGFLMGFQ